MKPFNELIKNFDKIREYLRAFSVYGYKQRDHFEHKSTRTYDNEKRRIQSYLNPYIYEQTSNKGKWICINFDYLSVHYNPIYDAFKTKSFTKNDIMLHFIILDLLMRFDKLTLNEIYDKLLYDYLEAFADCKLVDQRTLRLKLQEYSKYGLIIESREGKTSYYRLAPHPFSNLPEQTQTRLFTALSFYQNVAPLGLIGNFILDKQEAIPSYFAFSNLHFSNNVDDLLVYKLFTAIANHQRVTFIHQKGKETTELPLKLIDNVEQGRRYVMVYQHQNTKYHFYRLDRLESVKLLEEKDDTFTQKLQIINTLLNTAWGISLSNMDYACKSEKWELILHIDEQTEKHIIKALESAHSNAILQRVSPNTFHYTLTVLDASETVPWLRQFIGRIISIHSTNIEALRRFKKDIKLMQSYYEEDEDDTI